MSRSVADVEWQISPATAGGSTYSWEAIHAALLMDIRRELRTLNSLLGCRNATAIPAILREIALNTSPYQCRKHRPALPFKTRRGLAQHQRRAHPSRATSSSGLRVVASR